MPIATFFEDFFFGFSMRNVHKFLAIVCGGLFALTGCNPAKPVTVKGTVTFPPSIKVLDTDNVEVRFIPSDPKAPAAIVSYNPKDGSFTTEVFPGKYKVAVKLAPYPGTPDADKRIRALENFTKSFDESATPLQVEVGSELEQSIKIDMVAKSVTKG